MIDVHFNKLMDAFIKNRHSRTLEIPKHFMYKSIFNKQSIHQLLAFYIMSYATQFIHPVLNIFPKNLPRERRS